MTSRVRALYVLVGLFAAAIAGCSSGGGSPTTNPTHAASATPTGATATPTATGATPTPSPSGIVTSTPVPAETTPPTGAAIAVTSRPLTAGDTFAYSGTSTQGDVYEGTFPNPTVTTVVSIAQSIAVTGSKTFGGHSGLTDFTNTETDESPLQKIGLSVDSYYALTTGANGGQALTTYGYASSDTNGQTLNVTYANPGYPGNGTVDLIPEARATWSNSGAQTIAETESDGFSDTRTYAANGSYTDNATYPQSSQTNPQPTPLTATITENGDGSGTYNLPLLGPPNLIVTYATPDPSGAVEIDVTDPNNGNENDQSATVGVWWPRPLKLYSEVDRDNGAVTFPSACNVPAAYGTQGNEVEQKSERTDTVLGTLEFYDELSYVVANTGVVCEQISDVVYIYYDYSGQSNGSPFGVSYSGGNSPLETQTATTTIGLVAATTSAEGRRTLDRTGGAGFAMANARIGFLAALERSRADRMKKMYRFYRSIAAAHKAAANARGKRIR